MAKYRSLHVKVWADPEFERFTTAAKLLFLYLLTNPNRTESGIYDITEAKMGFECSLSIADVTEALRELSVVGKVRYDPSTSTVWIVNAVKHQALNANCVKSIAHDLQRCPNATMVEAFCRYYETYPPLSELCSSFLDTEEPERATETGRRGDEAARATEQDTEEPEVSRSTSMSLAKRNGTSAVVGPPEEWRGEMEPIYDAYMTWYGHPPPANHAAAIRQLLQPKGSPSGYWFKVDGQRQLLNGYTIDEIARTVEVMAKAQHHKPDALAGHLSGEYTKPKGYSKNGTASSGQRGRNTADRLRRSFDRLDAAGGAAGADGGGSELDGRTPVEAGPRR